MSKKRKPQKRKSGRKTEETTAKSPESSGGQEQGAEGSRSEQKDHPSQKPLAREVEAHYLRPAPGAKAPMPPQFPAVVAMTLIINVVLGALIGGVLGWLALTHTLVLPNMEQLYSLYPGNFIAFWIFAGAALGIATGGVAGLLMAP